MLAERLVIIATTPGTRGLPVTTLCKIPSHAPFKLLPIDRSSRLKFASSDPVSLDRPPAVRVERCQPLSTCGSRAPVRLSQRRLRKRISHRGRSSNIDWRFDHDLAPGRIEFRPSIAKIRPISSGRLRISFESIRSQFCRSCCGTSAMLTVDPFAGTDIGISRRRFC